MVCRPGLLALSTPLGPATRVQPPGGHCTPRATNRPRVFSLAGVSLSQLGFLLQGQQGEWSTALRPNPLRTYYSRQWAAHLHPTKLQLLSPDQVPSVNSACVCVWSVCACTCMCVGAWGRPINQAGYFDSCSLILSHRREQLHSSMSIQWLAWPMRGQGTEFFSVPRVPTSAIFLLCEPGVLSCLSAGKQPGNPKDVSAGMWQRRAGLLGKDKPRPPGTCSQVCSGQCISSGGSRAADEVRSRQILCNPSPSVVSTHCRITSLLSALVSAAPVNWAGPLPTPDVHYHQVAVGFLRGTGQWVGGHILGGPLRSPSRLR